MGCSNDNFWKLDKWDKIGIASLIVFFTIFVVLNTFSFGADSISFNSLDNAVVNVSLNKIVESTGGKILYAPLQKNSKYSFQFSVGSASLEPQRQITVRICKASEVSIGSTVVVLSTAIIDDNSKDFTYEFNTFSDGNYFLVISLSGAWFTTLPNDVFKLYNINGNYNNVISDLVDNVSFNLWNVFNNGIPFILVVVLVSFGFYLIIHAIKEVSKGRDI